MSEKQVDSMCFYGIDGDKIGSIVELYIIEDKMDALSKFSTRVEISNVMLFELKKPGGGVQALYHNLKEIDYEQVILPDWEPLIGNIEFFSARQNRQKLWVVVASILISLCLTIIYQFVRVTLGESNWLSWLLIVAIAVIGLVGGITPIVDAWGGIRLALGLDRRYKSP